MRKKQWTVFETETCIQCAYSFNEETKEYMVKVITKMPKIHYYSALNDAGKTFDESIFPTLNYEK